MQGTLTTRASIARRFGSITVAGALLVAGGALGGGIASAAPLGEDAPTSARHAAEWIAAELEADPTAPLVPGWTPGTYNLGTSAEAVTALAGLHPIAEDIYDALVARREEVVAPWGSESPGRLALMVLAARSLGEDPNAVGDAPGDNLVDRLEAQLQADGLYGAGDPKWDGAYRQGLSILALTTAGRTVPAAAIEWLRDQQCAEGGWASHRPDLTVPCGTGDPAVFPDTNSTALAWLALSRVDVTPPADPMAWLLAIQNADGGFGYGAGSDTDPSSSGLIAEAAIAWNRLAELTQADGDTPISAILGHQLGCEADSFDRGAFTYSLDEASVAPDFFSSVQPLNALQGRSRPVLGPLQPADGEPADPCAPPTTTTTTTTVAPTTVPATTVPATTAPETTAPETTEAPVAETTAAPTTVAVAVAGEQATRPTPAALAVTGTSPLLALAGALALALGGLLLAVRRRFDADGA